MVARNILHADGWLLRQWQVHANHMAGGTVHTHHDASILQPHGLPGSVPCAATEQCAALHWQRSQGHLSPWITYKPLTPTCWVPDSCTSPITMTHPLFTGSRTSSTRAPPSGLSASSPPTQSCSRTPGTCPTSPTCTTCVPRRLRDPDGHQLGCYDHTCP